MTWAWDLELCRVFVALAPGVKVYSSEEGLGFRV